MSSLSAPLALTVSDVVRTSKGRVSDTPCVLAMSRLQDHRSLWSSPGLPRQGQGSLALYQLLTCSAGRSARHPRSARGLPATPSRLPTGAPEGLATAPRNVSTTTGLRTGSGAVTSPSRGPGASRQQKVGCGGQEDPGKNCVKRLCYFELLLSLAHVVAEQKDDYFSLPSVAEIQGQDY